MRCLEHTDGPEMQPVSHISAATTADTGHDNCGGRMRPDCPLVPSGTGGSDPSGAFSAYLFGRRGCLFVNSWPWFHWTFAPPEIFVI